MEGSGRILDCVWYLGVAEAIHKDIVLLVVAVGVTLLDQVVVALFLADVFIDGMSMGAKVAQLLYLNFLLLLLTEKLPPLEVLRGQFLALRTHSLDGNVVLTRFLFEFLVLLSVHVKNREFD